MKLVSRALAGLVMAAFPSFAHAQTFGDIEANLSYTWLNGGVVNSPEAKTLFAGGGQARFGMLLGSGYLVQGDMFGEVTNRHNADDTYISGFGGALHAGWRDPRQMYFGFFGGALQTRQDNDNTDTSVRGFVGAEGQMFAGNMTFYGQAGWFGGEGGNDDAGKDSLHNAGFVRGVARYFITPNTKLEGELSGAWGKMDIDDDKTRVIGWGLKLEHQFASNWSTSLGYAGANYHQSNENESINEHVVRVGLKYHFNSGTLIFKDRNGASLDTPSFMRWSGHTGGPLE